MDTAAWVAIWIAIGIAVLGGLGTVLWYFIRRVLVGLDSIQYCVKKTDFEDFEKAFNQSQLDAERSRTRNTEMIGERAKQTDLEILERDVDNFKTEAFKTFITQPVITQIMQSLDRTLQQLTQSITQNSQTSQSGMDALNKRIDHFMQRNNS